jgi:penicillin-binding protein 2
MSESTRSDFQPWRLRFVIISLLAVFGLFLGRMFMLQVVSGQEFVEQADDNRTTTITLHTERGVIYDRNGIVLARNVPSYNLVIVPGELPDDDGDIETIYRELSALVAVPVTAGEVTEETARLFTPCRTDFGIKEIVFIAGSIAPYRAVQIACDIPEDMAMAIKEESGLWPGVDIEVVAIREYPTGVLTGEVVGFLGPIPAAFEDYYREFGYEPNIDKVGYAGVEASLQDTLGGVNGYRVVEVDALGQVVRDLEDPVEPIPGQNVRLTIDLRLQTAARAAIEKHFEGWNAYVGREWLQNGAVIAMNPKTGEVLAMVSYPTVENNRMARFIPAEYYNQIANDPLKPLINHAISAEHPPGSVYKLAASIGVLNEDIVGLNEIIECPDAGRITVLQKFTPNDPGVPQDYVCWRRDDAGNRTGHGDVSWHQSIAWSCDVYFYKVSGGYLDEVPQGLGVWLMGDYARALGYGELTGIELPGEQDGLVPDPNWKRVNVGETWATGDTYIASMGQGYVLSTPLQVGVSFNILVNEGKYMQPTLVYELLDPSGDVIQPFEPRLKWDITQDALIPVYDENRFATGEFKTVDPQVIAESMVGMRMVVTDAEGTGRRIFEGSFVESGGKTGTAEYCDDKAAAEDRCKPGAWPAHAWYVGYAPYDDPEIVVVAFVYDGTEGSEVAAPIVRDVLEAWYLLQQVDQPTGN